MAEHTTAEWRKFILEVLEDIEDTKFLYQIYSLVWFRRKREQERRRAEWPTC